MPIHKWIRGEIVKFAVWGAVGVIVTVLFAGKHFLENQKKFNSNSVRRRFQKIIIIALVVIDVLLFAISALGVEGVDKIVSSNVNASYLNEIDSKFHEEFTIKEKNDCKEVVYDSLLDEQNTRVAVEENYTGPAPSSNLPKNVKDFSDELAFWKNRCENSNNPSCYKVYASTACEYVKCLVNLDDYKNHKNQIKDNSEICIDNYRTYLMFNSIAKAERSDALYRIAQLTEVLSTINDEHEDYRAKMLLLSMIYYELANECKTNDSMYKNDCLYYLGTTYEKYATHSKTKESIDWLLSASEYYLTSLKNGYKSKDCRACLSRVYRTLSEDVKKYEDEIVGSQYKSAEDYAKLSQKYAF